MGEITGAQLDDFCTKHANFRDQDLTEEPQRALLDAILKLAWRATAPEERLTIEFNGCFNPDDAALLLAYDPPGGAEVSSVSMIPRLIKGLIR